MSDLGPLVRNRRSCEADGGVGSEELTNCNRELGETKLAGMVDPFAVSASVRVYFARDSRGGKRLQNRSEIGSKVTSSQSRRSPRVHYVLGPLVTGPVVQAALDTF